MGNQGHSEENYFQFKAWTEAGIIKDVEKITCFMNNGRRWHGMKVSDYLPSQPIPATLDWDKWLSTAQFKEYNKGYINGDWRSWFEFGNGALGDWGAHIFDTAHQFLKLGLPFLSLDINSPNPFGLGFLLFNFILPNAPNRLFCLVLSLSFPPLPSNLQHRLGISKTL
jgi:hypothetical protein